MWSAEGGGSVHSKNRLVSSRQHRATEVQKVRFLSSCHILTGVTRQLLGPHDTLPCVFIKIFVSIASLHTWHLKWHAMHPGYFRFPQVHSQVQSLKKDIQYLRMTRSNFMLGFSGTVLDCCTRKIHTSRISYTVVVDVFTEIFIYRLRSSFVKGEYKSTVKGGYKSTPQ